VISGNLGVHDAAARYHLPADEIRDHVERFIRDVRAA